MPQLWHAMLSCYYFCNTFFQQCTAIALRLFNVLWLIEQCVVLQHATSAIYCSNSSVAVAAVSGNSQVTAFWTITLLRCVACMHYVATLKSITRTPALLHSQLPSSCSSSSSLPLPSPSIVNVLLCHYLSLNASVAPLTRPRNAPINRTFVCVGLCVCSQTNVQCKLQCNVWVINEIENISALSWSPCALFFLSNFFLLPPELVNCFGCF